MFPCSYQYKILKTSRSTNFVRFLRLFYVKCVIFIYLVIYKYDYNITTFEEIAEILSRYSLCCPDCINIKQIGGYGSTFCGIKRWSEARPVFRQGRRGTRIGVFSPRDCFPFPCARERNGSESLFARAQNATIHCL